ncbi:MAG TPA: OmpA family protein [Sandaracinaceae bacterium LLY-WYZ-13_1]|nr:OmpA family protein [Sandaracinaceae bacterium LLY-WYZ-13_1]
MFRHALGRGAFALSLLVLAASGVTSPSTAHAQDGEAGALTSGGMDLHLFRPAVDSKGHLSVNGTDILPHLGISFGLLLDGGFGILPFDGFVNSRDTLAENAERCPGLLCERLVQAQLTGTLHFNLGLANLMVVGVQVPVSIGSGSNISVPGFYNWPDTGSEGATGLDNQSLGNLALHGKIRILRAERNDGFGLGAILQLEFPTANTSQFAGDPTFVIWPHVMGEYRASRGVRFGLDVGYRLVIGDGAPFPVGGRTEPGSMNATMPILTGMGSNFVYDDQITFGLGASFRLGDAPLDLVLETYGNYIMSGIDGRGDFGVDGTLNLEALLGLKIFVERNSYLVFGFGGGLPTNPLNGATQADVRGLVGFIFEPSIGDRDGDGLRDDVDECPDEPEDFDGFADEDGCPDPDNDRDGILDVDDECPMVPEDRDGDADEDGCPEGNEGDRDGDGILDNEDECPDDPEDRDGFQDEDGCPDPDNDSDGILDTDDLCPNDPEDQDDFQDQDGCPDPDNDSDRILDVDDTCPNEPETYNGTEDEDGCPDTGSVIIEENSIVILEKIYFETDSAEILPRSFPIIEAVAATLVGNPHITMVEVQGHADERSSDEYNIRLTRDRAAAVVEALVQRGVQRDRLRSAGYGERCPVDPRHNAEAWERNRRVEFKIIRTEDGPTGVEVACPAGRELVPR